MIARGGNTEITSGRLTSIMNGSHQSAFAAQERQGRQNFCDVLTTAIANGDHYTLSGAKVLVMNGGAAETLVVTARTSGEQFDRNGISLFLVEAGQNGVTTTVIPMMDGTRVANIQLTDVDVPASSLLGALGEAWPLIEGGPELLGDIGDEDLLSYSKWPGRWKLDIDVPVACHTPVSGNQTARKLQIARRDNEFR